MRICRRALTSARSGAKGSSGRRRTCITSTCRRRGRRSRDRLRPRAYDTTKFSAHRSLAVGGEAAARQCAGEGARVACRRVDARAGAQQRRRRVAVRACGLGRSVLRLRAYEFSRRRLHRAAARDDVADRAARGLFAADDRGGRQRLPTAGPRDAGRACAVRSGGAGDAEDRRSLLEAARRRRVEGRGQAAQSDFDDHLSVQSAGRARVEGDGRAGEAELARHPADRQPPLSSAAVGAHDVPGRPLRRLHVRAAADRKRSGRAEGAVLSQQRRLRRSDLLSRRQFLQPRQHQARHDDVPSGGLYARAASEGVCGGREVGAQGNRRGRGDDRHARCARRDARGGGDRRPQLCRQLAGREVKLASLKQGRDGKLIVVSRDL